MEQLEATVERLEQRLEDKTDTVYDTASSVQQTLDNAIDFRSAKRAEARDYLKQIEANEERDDGTN